VRRVGEWWESAWGCAQGRVRLGEGEREQGQEVAYNGRVDLEYEVSYQFTNIE